MRQLIKSLLFTFLVAAISTAHAEPFREGVVAYQKKNYQKAFNAWLPLAKSGHVLAQTLVGSMYVYGEGVEKDDAEALNWLSLAAASGSSQAQYNLGILYEKGFGTPINTDKALKWFKTAADQGREDAATRYAQLSEQTGTTNVSENNNVPVATVTETVIAPPERIHLALNDDAELLGPPNITMNEPPLSPQDHGLVWAQQQPKDNYTIQLAASIEPRLINAFKEHIKLTSNYADVISSQNGRQWHAVIYGSYTTVADAKKAIAEFPNSWTTWQPWIKRFSSIKAIKR